MSARARKIFNERAAGLVLVCAVAVGGVWALVRYGPRPTGPEETPADARAPNDRPATAAAPASPTAAAPQDARPLFGLLGVGGELVAEGRDSRPTTEFADEVEGRYVRRGYRVVGERAAGSGRRGAGAAKASKVYWRGEYGGFALVGAVGPDADPTSEAETPEPRMYATLVMREGGGARWATYSYAGRPGTQAHEPFDAAADLPGSDPPAVPRPPGLQRLLSFANPEAPGSSLALYSTAEAPQALRDWYAREMPGRGWRYDPLATGEAGRLVQGVSCFTRAGGYCLIWIDADPESGRSTVVVSSNRT